MSISTCQNGSRFTKSPPKQKTHLVFIMTLCASCLMSDPWLFSYSSVGFWFFFNKRIKNILIFFTWSCCSTWHLHLTPVCLFLVPPPAAAAAAFTSCNLSWPLLLICWVHTLHYPACLWFHSLMGLILFTFSAILLTVCLSLQII